MNAKRLLIMLAVCLAGASFIALIPPNTQNPKDWNGESNLYPIMKYLGYKPLPHDMAKIDPDQVKRGEEIIKYGRTIDLYGNTSNYISKYYACTSCHNLEREDPDLKAANPDTRLPYLADKGLPMYQATTFYGMVNKESWYNDDYYIKYGDLVKPANKSLREAIQLCARECAQGRPMEQWEEDATLAYLWSLQYKLSDLQLSADNMAQLQREADQAEKRKELVEGLKYFYMQKSPATFADPPHDKVAGYSQLTGVAKSGKMVYESSCQKCHQADGVSEVILDNSAMTFGWLKRNMMDNTHYSIYEIIRHGLHSHKSRHQYMPHYTKEKLSDQQIEDLRAYIEEMAG